MKASRKRRNGPVWGLSHFSQGILCGMDLDLRRHENSGFTDELHCTSVKTAIRIAADAISVDAQATVVAAKLRDLLSIEYLTIYTKWNEVKGIAYEQVTQRKKYREHLRQLVKDFKSILEECKPEVYTRVAHKNVDQMVLAFSPLESEYSKKFSAVSTAVRKYRGARERAWSRERA